MAQPSIPRVEQVQGGDKAVYAQDQQVHADDIAEGEEGDKRVDYHNKAKDYAEDVQHEREIVIAAAAGETDEGQTGQPGDAVGDEPDGEEHHECPGPGGGVEQYHQAGEYAQNAARERETGAEARALLELDVKHYVYDARDEGQDAV